MLKLCSELDIYYKREYSADFVHHVSSTVITPCDNTPMILFYASHIFGNPFPEKTIQRLINKGFVIVYFTDKIPADALISESVVYIKAKWRYFDVHTIKNLNMFSAIGGEGQRGERLALEVARVFHKQLIRENTDLDKIKRIIEKDQEEVTILFDTIFECGDRGLGDILLTTPIIKALKEKFNAKITYAVRDLGAELLKNNPDIEHVVSSYEKLDRQRYTYHLPLIRHVENYKVARNRQNRVDAMAQLFMVKLDNRDKHPHYYPADDEISWAKRNIVKSKKVRLGINIEATSGARRWIPEYLTELLDKIDYKQFEVYLIGNGSRTEYKEIPDKVNNFIGKTTLRQAVALVSQMDMMLCTDSMYSHLSAAFDIPQVTLYTVIPAVWRNKYYRSIAVQGNTTCCPCCDFQFVTEEAYNECDRFGTPQCVKSITPNRVLKAIKECYIKFNLSDKKHKKYIAVNRSSGLGDILMITPAIHEIRKKNPDAFITVRTNHPELLQDNPDIDEVIFGKHVADEEIEAIFYSYDKIINFDYCLESFGVAGTKGKLSDKDYMSVPRLNLIFREIGEKIPNDVKLHYYPTDEERVRAKKIIGSLDNRKTVLFVMNSTSPFRTYPIDASLKVIQELLKDYNVIATGNNLKMWTHEHHYNKAYYAGIEDFDDFQFVDMVDKTSLRSLIALMSECDLVITPDTGTLHCAAAVDTPTIALFGNIHPNLRTSYYKKCVSLYKEIECAKDCGDRGHLMIRGDKICPDYEDIARHHGAIGARCMRAITPQEIVKHANNLLKARV